MRRLSEGRTLTIFPVTGVTIIQEVLDFTDMEIISAFAVTFLFANGSHQPIALARRLGDARGYTVTAGTVIVPTRSMRWRRGSAPTLLVVAIIILELLALAFARIRKRRSIARLRDGMRVIRRNGRVEVHPDP